MKTEELILKMIPHVKELSVGLDDDQILVWEFIDGIYTVRLQQYIVANLVIDWDLSKPHQSAIFKTQSLDNTYLSREQALSGWIKFRDNIGIGSLDGASVSSPPFSNCGGENT